MTRSPRFGPKEWQLAYAVALRILKAPDQAEDAAQETLLKAYRALGQFEGRARFESWLYRIAYTTALSKLRRRRSELVREPANDQRADEALAAVPDAPEAAPDELAAASELVGCVEGCLAKMRELDRVAFTERFIVGLSERELGELLGVSTNAAKQRAFRARRALQACIAAQRPS